MHQNVTVRAISPSRSRHMWQDLTYISIVVALFGAQSLEDRKAAIIGVVLLSRVQHDSALSQIC